MWAILFFVSLLINSLFVFHTLWSIKILKSLSEDMSVIQEEVDTFTEHLTALNEMEMFYGDETLTSLLVHSQSLSTLLSEVDLIIDSPTEELENQESFPAPGIE